jgi:tetratricopeptide (TPR) repeat protein
MVDNQELFQKALNQGHSAAWDKNWDQAATFYRQALNEIPDQPQALNNLGLALFELQQFDQALVCYRRAMAVTPEDPLPFERAAQICERLGRLNDATRAALQAADLYIKNRDIEKAIENWIRVTRLSPENISAHTRLAMIYERQGARGEAVSEYLAVAALVQHGGDVVKASQAVNYALQMMPESGEARQAQALLRANQLLPKPARPRGGTGPVLMSKVRQMEPAHEESDQAQVGAAPVAEALQKTLLNLASVLFDQAETEGQNSRRGLSEIARGNTGQLSLEQLEQAEQARAQFYVGRAVDAQTKGQEDVALAELQKAVDAGLKSPAVSFDLGYLQAKDKRWEQAVQSLRMVIQDPDYALAGHLLTGVALRSLHRLPEAAGEYLEALKLADAQTVDEEQAAEIRQLYDPIIEAQARVTDVAALEKLCTNIESQLNRSDWREYLAKARSQLPPSPPGSPPVPLAEVLIHVPSSQVIDAIAMIRNLSNRNCTRSAMEAAHFALDLAPTYLPLHIQMAELLIKERREEEAVLKLGVVATAYSTRGEPAQAIQTLQRILKLTPMDIAIRNRLVDQYQAKGLIDDAVSESLIIADIYLRQAELDMARKTYMTALRQAQQSPSNRAWNVKILHRIADIDIQRLDWRQAMRAYEQIRTLQPGDEKARLTLVDLNLRMSQDGVAITELDGYLNHLQNRNEIDRAVPILESLVADWPRQVELHKRMADVYRQVGKTEKAISEYDVVGDLQLSIGNRQGAIAAIKAILSMNPPNSLEYQRLLQQI